ncbi:ABC transporter permease [Bosea sp. BK604]|uniref:ABC transporter permease n=1 Tax=Bosea sp. BK604 TaxID=2512180 RepID=UPI0010E4C060|nr:ABC transporter permease [Bosea sp. BK604]TCR60614.1 peptide/nickel transport system permease protein [Bosea sp. BK604]
MNRPAEVKQPVVPVERPAALSTEARAGTVKSAVEGGADTPFRQALREFVANPFAVFGAVLLTLLVFGAIFAEALAPTNPYDLTKLDLMDALQPPGTQNMDGSVTFLLGTDGQGRDMLSAMLYGLRTSILVGVSSGVIALCVGATIGIVAAFFGGWIDSFVMRIVDLQLSFPSILVAMVLLALLGQGVDKIILALVIVQWAYYARTVRSAALVERSKEYVEAAICLGIGRTPVMFRHMLRNCLPPLIVIATVQVGSAISLEATLSFLGLGLPVTKPSLGLLISNGFAFLMSGKYWISLYPGVLLLVTIIAINLVGDHLRDILNPRLKR